MLTGDDIRRMRTKAGLSQKTFSNKIEVSESTIKNWENGVGEPKVSQLFTICRVCGLNIIALISKLAFRKRNSTPLDMEALKDDETG